MSPYQYNVYYTKKLSIQKINDDNRQNDISQRNGKQKFPAEIHQLVKAKTRQRSAHPNVEKQEKENFQQKANMTRNRVGN